ncbi:zinc finger CCCH domain-containing protein 5 [Cornus florida]|uniref:zinc finger CCCH domain-containing protein 5 n=1 Tax=Cornus florida TaxID=4283 RepID=UPI0028A23300|nr:zinc finger CCCH domain-containing protein 5 [Cornus florida]
MSEPVAGEEEGGASGCARVNPQSVVGVSEGGGMSRKEKRKAAKKEKRKQKRKELAAKELEEEAARLNDPEEQRRIQLEEERESERLERDRKEFEEHERQFLEALARKKAEEEEEGDRRKALEEELNQNQVEHQNELKEDEDWEYVEERPPEIIWQGNEIIVKKNRVKVKKKDVDQRTKKEDLDRPTSNPLPPQSEAFADYKSASTVSAQQLLDNAAQQIPNFGTEQDKAHCPFHIKTGACRFGVRCSRVHFYPDKSCTLLIKNMYSGPGLAWEQDEGLEYTDEEVERCYEEFYEDVHTEFLKFGEIVNFKVCRNGSFHLRGNVYVHYKSLDSAVFAHHSINGRYFAGKQVKCEFVGVTRWKVAICGEYMKSRLKTCSRGTACNFIHCFRNPGGDYEWADWDKPPPKYWVREMAALFGYSDETGYDKQMEQESAGQLRGSSKVVPADKDRYNSRRSRPRAIDSLNSNSGGSYHEENDIRRRTRWQRHRNDDRKQMKIPYEKNCEEEANSISNHHSKKRNCDVNSDVDGWDRDGDGDEHHNSTRRRSRHHVKVLKFQDERGDGKNRCRENCSDGDWSDGDGDSHHYRTRRSTRHQKKTSEILDDHGYGEKRTRTTDSSGDWLDKNRDGDMHCSHKEKRSRRQNEVSESPDEHWIRNNRIHDSDSSGDWSDRNRDRHCTKTRKRRRHSNEVLGYTDNHAEPEKLLKDIFQCRESHPKKFKRRGDPKRSHSSRRGCSDGEASDGDFADEGLKSDGKHDTSSSGQYSRRIKSHGLDGNVDEVVHEDHFPEKHLKSKRTVRMDEKGESDSPGRYGERSKSHTDEEIEEQGRWDPDFGQENVPKRRKKKTPSRKTPHF